MTCPPRRSGCPRRGGPAIGARGAPGRLLAPVPTGVLLFRAILTQAARRPSMPKTVPSVVVLNSSQDTIDLLKVVLEEQGFTVASAHVASVKSGEIDVLEFVNKHSPDVIVYDV